MWWLTTARFAEIQSHQLNHVGLEEINIPPGWALHFGHSARIGCEESACAAVDGTVSIGVQCHTRLHRRFTSSHVHHWKRIFHTQATQSGRHETEPERELPWKTTNLSAITYSLVIGLGLIFDGGYGTLIFKSFFYWIDYVVFFLRWIGGLCKSLTIILNYTSIGNGYIYRFGFNFS